MEDRGRRRWRGALAVSVTVGALVAGVLFLSLRPGPDLEALRADPMATWTPPAGHLTRSHERESGTTLGKPGYAGITRIFRTADPQAAVTAAQAQAHRHGWRTRWQREGYFSAVRHVPGWRLELSVGRASVTGVPGNLYVSLAAYPA